MAWTNPKSWSTSDVLTASDLNTYVRDNLNAIGTLQSYTPAWTASTTNPSLGNGSLQGRYIASSSWCWFQVLLVAGSTTTAGSGIYSISLPVLAAGVPTAAEQPILCSFNRTGFARFFGVGVVFTGASSFQVNEPAAWSASASSFWGNTTPFAFAANGNVFSAQGMYRLT